MSPAPAPAASSPIWGAEVIKVEPGPAIRSASSSARSGSTTSRTACSRTTIAASSSIALDLTDAGDAEVLRATGRDRRRFRDQHPPRQPRPARPELGPVEGDQARPDLRQLHRLWLDRRRCRQARLRHHRLLGTLGAVLADQRQGRRPGAIAHRHRRSHVGDGARRRDHGRAVPSRAHRRGTEDRDVAAAHGRVRRLVRTRDPAPDEQARLDQVAGGER